MWTTAKLSSSWAIFRGLSCHQGKTAVVLKDSNQLWEEKMLTPITRQTILIAKIISMIFIAVSNS